MMDKGFLLAVENIIERTLATIWAWLHPLDEELTPHEAQVAVPQ